MIKPFTLEQEIIIYETIVGKIFLDEQTDIVLAALRKIMVNEWTTVLLTANNNEGLSLLLKYMENYFRDLQEELLKDIPKVEEIIEEKIP